VDDIAAFIAARLDERETMSPELHEARVCSGCSDGWEAGFNPDRCDCGYPGLVLREVAALRAIVRRCEGCMNEPDQYPNGLVSPRALLARQTLIWLTSIWSDQPDYRQEWKP
jgi:hypothetical protein